MTKKLQLSLLFGLLLIAAPFTKNTAFADEYGDDDEDEAEAAPAEPAGEDEKDVVVLTAKNFDDIVKKSKFALVEFYAPWCGHCKTLKPHYAKAATELKSYDAAIVIGKVDATIESALGEKFGVKGYPTLKWFVDGELHSDYNGGREADGLVSWIKKKTGPATIKVDTVAALTEKEESSEVLVVGFFKALKGAEYDAFKATAAKTEGPIFIETTDAKVAQAAGIKTAPGVVVIKNFKGEAREAVLMPGKITAESVGEFVLAEKLPLTLEFNSANNEKIFQSGINKHMIMWAKASEIEAGSEAFKTFSAVAKAFKGKLMFVTANNEEEAAEPITNFFGLKGAESPSVVGFFMEKNKKFKYSGADLNEKDLTAFATSLVDGTAAVEFKSAPIPENDKDEGVTVVVGKSFETIVLDKTKDVLLEAYAPWCGHCKTLAPIYVKLAKRFESIGSVVIAKFDGTENEHSEVEVKGFPSLMLFPAGEDQAPITFDGGDRSLKALTEFLKKNAKIPFELPEGTKEEEAGPEAGASSEEADEDNESDEYAEVEEEAEEPEEPEAEAKDEL